MSLIINTGISVEYIGLFNTLINLLIGTAALAVVFLLDYAITSHLMSQKYLYNNTNNNNTLTKDCAPPNMDVAELLAIDRARRFNLKAFISALTSSTTARSNAPRQQTRFWMYLWIFALASLHVAKLIDTAMITAVTVREEVAAAASTGGGGGTTETRWLSSLLAGARLDRFVPETSLFIGHGAQRPKDSNLTRAVFGETYFRRVSFRHTRVGNGTIVSCPHTDGAIPQPGDSANTTMVVRQECLRTTAVCTPLVHQPNCFDNGYCLSGIRVGENTVHALNWTVQGSSGAGVPGGTTYPMRRMRLDPGQVFVGIYDNRVFFVSAGLTAADGGVKLGQILDELYDFYLSAHTCDYSADIIETQVKYAAGDMFLDPLQEGQKMGAVKSTVNGTHIATRVYTRDTAGGVLSQILQDMHNFCPQKLGSSPNAQTQDCSITDIATLLSAAIVLERLFPDDKMLQQQALSAEPPLVLLGVTRNQQRIGLNAWLLLAMVALAAWPFLLSLVLIARNFVLHGQASLAEARRLSNIEQWICLFVNRETRQADKCWVPVDTWLRAHGSTQVGTRLEEVEEEDGKKGDRRAALVVGECGELAECELPTRGAARLGLDLSDKDK